MLTHAAARALARARASPDAFPPSPQQTRPSPRAARGRVRATEYSIKLTAEEARKCLKFDALVVADNERAIFVSGVARESDCERCGVVPGQRLRALTNPVDKSKLWVVGDAERLAFVKDAIPVDEGGGDGARARKGGERDVRDGQSGDDGGRAGGGGAGGGEGQGA